MREGVRDWCKSTMIDRSGKVTGGTWCEVEFGDVGASHLVILQVGDRPIRSEG